MQYRVQLRMSFNRDKSSATRNKIGTVLMDAGITQRQVNTDNSGRSTGTWEGTQLDAKAMTALRDVLTVLEGLQKDPDPTAPALDHIWLYIDRD